MASLCAWRALPRAALRGRAMTGSAARAESASPAAGPARLAPLPDPFALPAAFVAAYERKPTPFGFNGLGELVYYRTYSRTKADGTHEAWHETVERVVNGTFRLQQRWRLDNGLVWDPAGAMRDAREMYDRIFRLKFVPPGRGLWAMGSPLTEERGLYAALNNCAFVSTEGVREHPSRPFCFLMDASMLGVGVGFDTRGAEPDLAPLVRSPTDKGAAAYEIPDSREGWVQSLRLLIESYFDPSLGSIDFDYSLVRPAGEPIKGFGGVASGPGPLKELHDSVRDTLDRNCGRPLSVTSIVDIFNLIGRCVVAGNVRRTAEIAFGDAESDEYIDLKNYAVNPQRAGFGWTSNNSIFARLGMDYSRVAERIGDNGEPGIAWLDNMRRYGRMGDPPNNKDHRAKGGNPCLEQTLESNELCCLVETFPNRHDSLDDYLDTLRCALLYAKTVTLGKTHWPESNLVMERNRRIGCSVSGIAQFLAQRGIGELRHWLDAGYDEVRKLDTEFSDAFCVRESIKLTCVKPSGTVSLLAGASPGIHHPESRFYIRRVRLARTSRLLPPLQEAGYRIEPTVHDPTSMVVEIPVDSGAGVRSVREVSMWEQLSLAAFMQRHWADNQVSCTVTFDPATEGTEIAKALNFFQYELKGISFLPRIEAGAYEQMPYEAIDESEYTARLAEITTNIDYDRHAIVDANANHGEAPDKFCDTDFCNLDDPVPDPATSQQQVREALEEALEDNTR